MSDEQLNILIIEDDPDMRRLLVDIVTREEHQAVPAASAEEGLELLPFWTFQIALLDHNLPGIEGLVLGEYLRRNNPEMRIALVTGDEDRTLPRRTRDLAITFIRKPFDLADVRGVIASYQEDARRRRARRLGREDSDFEPPIARFADEIAGCYGVPKLPSRVEARVVETLKRSLNNLRSVNRYSERDRVLALSGLLAASVLGLDLPHSKEGKSLYEEYDELMTQHGRRREFSAE